MIQELVAHTPIHPILLTTPIQSVARAIESVRTVALEAPDTTLRETLTEHLEMLFGRLRGESLLVATLSYGLGVRISSLRDVKVRDVSLAEGMIVVAGRERGIPVVIREDLREHLEARTGEASSAPRREQRLFSEDAFALLAEESRRVDGVFSAKFRATEGRRAKACLDSRLRILGWFHKKRAARKGLRFASALDLFDKGPRIVRRGRAGRVDAYYAWRAPRIFFL